jgi:hypothetical protein
VFVAATLSLGEASAACRAKTVGSAMEKAKVLAVFFDKVAYTRQFPSQKCTCREF